MTTSQISVIDSEVAIEIIDQNIQIVAIENPTAVLISDSGPQGPQGNQGIQGDQGIQGVAATIDVGSVFASEPGSSPSITNVGTSGDAVFNFVIPRGEQGPQGIPGEVQVSDLSYIHIQSVSSNTWTIVHELQFVPSITVVDSAGSVVEGDYSYPDENTVIATFSGGFTGKAYLS